MPLFWFMTKMNKKEQFDMIEKKITKNNKKFAQLLGKRAATIEGTKQKRNFRMARRQIFEESLQLMAMAILIINEKK